MVDTPPTETPTGSPITAPRSVENSPLMLPATQCDTFGFCSREALLNAGGFKLSL